MPLAFSLKDHYMTHAGDNQAEYHGWLCKKDVDQEFLIKSLIAIKKNFQMRKWKWRPMPPRSQIDWLSSIDLNKGKIYAIVAEQDSPILDLNDDDKINKIKKNKSIQIKLNRYKKKNGFYIERIKSKDKAEKIFDILSMQCDFRQMAIHQTAPFANDGNKKQFYLELMNYPENNHFTILWAENSPIAFHFGVCDSNTVYLGLFSYNPLEEKNSPGNIMLIKLIEFIKEEGFQYFDLTPGGDNYKEKYCSFHQKIHIPTIYFFKKDKIIYDLKYSLSSTIKKVILSIGGKPEFVKNKLKSVLAILKKNSKLTPLKLFRILYEKDVFLLYKFLFDGVSLNSFQTLENVTINNYSDLLLYNNSNPHIEKKSDLFSAALRHFSSDDLLYTIVLDGVLAQYGWMSKGRESLRITDFDTAFNFSENSYLLYDFFTEPNFSRQDLYEKTLETMLNDCRRKGANEVFICVSKKNNPSRSILEKIGFKVFRKFQQTKILWFVHKKEYS
jgi:hypothetical protein